MLTILRLLHKNLLPCKIQSKWAFSKRNVSVSKYNFEENLRLVMKKTDINNARYFTVIGVVVLEIFSKMTCFIESK